MAISTADETLEARVYNLLYPYRNESFEAPFPVDDIEKCAFAAARERKAMSLARNLAFLISNHRFKTEKTRRNKLAAAPEIGPQDVFITVTGCAGGADAEERGAINIAVRYPAAMQSVVRTNLLPGDHVIDKLSARVERALKATSM